MKIKHNILLSALFIICILNSNAQTVDNNYLKSSKNVHDTLMPLSFHTGTDTLYKFPDSVGTGYYFGTSMLGDRALAQEYKVWSPYVVYGIALKVGAFLKVGSADTLNVLMYKLDGPGTDSSGPVTNAPDTAFLNVMFPDSLVNTTGLTFITFPDSITVYQNYAAALGLTEMKDDTIGLISTKDGDAHNSQRSWSRWSDGTWHTILDPLSWNMDLDFGIFMIVNSASAGINDNYFIDGIKLSQNQPNPTNGSTLIQYEIDKDANVCLEIYDMSGKLVLSSKQGNQAAGKHNIIINTTDFNSGIYYYSLKAGVHRLTKKMVISQ